MCLNKMFGLHKCIIWCRDASDDILTVPPLIFGCIMQQMFDIFHPEYLIHFSLGYLYFHIEYLIGV